jgi:membrane protein
LVGGIGFSLLKLSASTLLPRVTANPLFASIAIVIGLLFWLNLIARLTLISAAWAANDVDDIHGVRSHALTPSPGNLAEPGASTDRGSDLPTFGARSGDSTTLAAGAVLGGVAVVAARVLTHGIRSVVGLARRE